MHELSIAQSILDTIEQALGGRKPLSAVTVSIGPFAGVSAEALRFSFTELAREGAFGEPELVINTPAARLVCRDCGEESAAESAFDPCPRCGSMNRTILEGRECFIESVEIEEGEDEQAQG